MKKAHPRMLRMIGELHTEGEKGGYSHQLMHRRLAHLQGQVDEEHVDVVRIASVTEDKMRRLLEEREALQRQREEWDHMVNKVYHRPSENVGSHQEVHSALPEKDLQSRLALVEKEKAQLIQSQESLIDYVKQNVLTLAGPENRVAGNGLPPEIYRHIKAERESMR